MINANEFRTLLAVYLEIHEITFTVKSYKYIINWDDTHQKLLDLKTAKKVYSLITQDVIDLQTELGDVLYNSVLDYFKQPIVSSLNFIRETKDLEGVHERFSEINPTQKEFRLHEVESTINYVLLELSIQGEHGSSKHLLGLTFTPNWCIQSEEVLFERCENNSKKIDVKKIIGMANRNIVGNCGAILDSQEAEHLKRIKELSTIRETHAAQKYKELHDKEYNISFKIGSAESKEKNAASFDTKYKWAQEVKSLTKKLVALQEKNRLIKNKIKDEFSGEDVSSYKELQVSSQALIVATVDTVLFEIMLGENEERFVYVPFCGKFVKKG